MNEQNPDAGKLSSKLAAKKSSGRGPEPKEPERLVVSTRLLGRSRVGAERWETIVGLSTMQLMSGTGTNAAASPRGLTYLAWIRFDLGSPLGYILAVLFEGLDFPSRYHLSLTQQSSFSLSLVSIPN